MAAKKLANSAQLVMPTKAQAVAALATGAAIASGWDATKSDLLVIIITLLVAMMKFIVVSYGHFLLWDFRQFTFNQIR